MSSEPPPQTSLTRIAELIAEVAAGFGGMGLPWSLMASTGASTGMREMFTNRCFAAKPRKRGLPQRGTGTDLAITSRKVSTIARAENNRGGDHA